jgi:hypothetical protein
MKIAVHCRSGYRVDEPPQSIQFDSLVVEVKTIEDRWLAPDHRYFKMIGDDDATYIIRQDVVLQTWELRYYKQAE